MKRVWILMGLLVLTAGMTPAFAGPKKWDSKLPKDQQVILAYDDEVRITQLDGEVKKLGPLPTAYPGAGTVKKPKASLIIPAGERTLSVQIGGVNGQWSDAKDVKFNFEAGKTYQIIAQQDDEKMLKDMYGENLDGKGGDKGKTLGKLMTGDLAIKFEIKDITKKK